MLISRRRFYWAIVLTLLFAVCVLVRPMRTWIDRGLVAAATGGNISVDKLQVHFGDSVIEAQGLEIHRTEGDRQFGMRAEKTWVAVDGVGVIDRRCAAPTVLVEDAVMYLGDMQPDPSKPVVAWYEALSERMAGITWADLQRHFGSVLSADSLATHWEEKIAALVESSEALLVQLNKIEAETADMDNPLRYEDAVQDRLRRLEELQAEQDEIMKQFAAARQQLEAEAKQLRSKFDAEKEAFAATAIDGDMSGMAGEILELSGREVWQQIAAYCEITSRMADINNVDGSMPWNRSFRNLNGPLVDLPLVKVAGVFESGVALGVPFSVKGSFVSNTGEDIAQSSWDYSFFQLQRVVDLDVIAREDRSQSILIDVRLDGDESDQRHAVTTGEIEIIDGQLTGELIVYASAFDYNPAAGDHAVSREQQILSAALSRQGSDACIAFNISGAWLSPKLTATQPVQDWLIDQIRESIRPNLQQAIANATEKMQAKLSTRLARIDRTAGVAAQGADSIASEHRNPLYAARNRLQASLDELSGASIRR